MEHARHQPQAGNCVHADADSVAEAFIDARCLYTMALDRLSAGDIRYASEKAWCATKRATDGLIIARTGKVPGELRDTSRMLREICRDDLDVEQLSGGFHEAKCSLHEDCFDLGLCEPLNYTKHVIRATSEYINEAERLSRGRSSRIDAGPAG